MMFYDTEEGLVIREELAHMGLHPDPAAHEAADALAALAVAEELERRAQAHRQACADRFAQAMQSLTPDQQEKILTDFFQEGGRTEALR